jgi:hypothetical protein
MMAIITFIITLIMYVAFVVPIIIYTVNQINGGTLSCNCLMYNKQLLA